MIWRRIKCWWVGHNVVQVKYVVKDTKKYHGHDEQRTFGCCSKCGKGTRENEMWTYQDGKSFMDRNDWVYPSVILVGVVVLFFAVIIVPTVYFSRIGCEDAGIQMVLESKYSFWSGCYYKVDGRWIADDLLSVVDLLK